MLQNRIGTVLKNISIENLEILEDAFDTLFEKEVEETWYDVPSPSVGGVFLGFFQI